LIYAGVIAYLTWQLIYCFLQEFDEDTPLDEHFDERVDCLVKINSAIVELKLRYMLAC
jgi:hypothetical protein